jgi:hypothetical protein
MVEEMKRLKIEVNFQKKTRSEIEMENMYLKEERLQWEADMDDLKSVVIEWRQEALQMREQVNALQAEVERQKQDITKCVCINLCACAVVRVRVRVLREFETNGCVGCNSLRSVGSSTSGIGNGSPIIESKHIDFKGSVRLGDGTITSCPVLSLAPHCGLSS